MKKKERLTQNTRLNEERSKVKEETTIGYSFCCKPRWRYNNTIEEKKITKSNKTTECDAYKNKQTNTHQISASRSVTNRHIYNI